MDALLSLWLHRGHTWEILQAHTPLVLRQVQDYTLLNNWNRGRQEENSILPLIWLCVVSVQKDYTQNWAWWYKPVILKAEAGELQTQGQTELQNDFKASLSKSARAYKKTENK